MFRKRLFLVLFSLFFVTGILLANGCSSSRTVTKREVVTSQPSDGGMPEGEKKETVTETKTKTSVGGGGVVSTTWHFIGEVLALPFQLVANLFRFIF